MKVYTFQRFHSGKGLQHFGEYPQMLSDLDSGILDLIITPQKGDDKGLSYEPFFKGKIVLVCNAGTPTEPFETLVSAKDQEGQLRWLKQQTWYGTTGDMEHQRRFGTITLGNGPTLSQTILCLTYVPFSGV